MVKYVSGIEENSIDLNLVDWDKIVCYGPYAEDKDEEIKVQKTELFDEVTCPACLLLLRHAKFITKEEMEIRQRYIPMYVLVRIWMSGVEDRNIIKEIDLECPRCVHHYLI